MPAKRKAKTLDAAVEEARAVFPRGDEWRWHAKERVLFAPIELAAARPEEIPAAVFARLDRRLDYTAGRVVTPVVHLFETLAARGFPQDGRSRWWGIRFARGRRTSTSPPPTSTSGAAAETEVA